MSVPTVKAKELADGTMTAKVRIIDNGVMNRKVIDANTGADLSSSVFGVTATIEAGKPTLVVMTVRVESLEIEADAVVVPFSARLVTKANEILSGTDNPDVRKAVADLLEVVQRHAGGA